MNSRAFAFAFLLGSFTLGACDCTTRTAKRDALIEFSPSLQFGTVAVGQKAVRKAQLKNPGTLTVTVAQLQTAPPFSTNLTTPFDVASGTTTDVEVTYAPTEPNAGPTEDHTGQVIAVNDTESNPRATITLSGHAIKATLGYAPEALEFGEVGVGESKDLEFTLENKGTDKFEVKSASLAAPFSGENLRLVGSYQPGSKTTVKIRYTPPQGGLDSGSLVIATDLPAQPQLSIPLSGKGLKSNVTVCFQVEGGTAKCLDATNKSGQMDFGAVQEGGAPKKGTVTIKNDGNIQVALGGALSGGATVRDYTAFLNPCKATPARPDFTFTPSGFDPKLPADATPSNPNPSNSQTLEIVYAPHHEPGCSDDIGDTGQLSVRAGSSGPVFTINLLGSSRVGLVKTDNFFAQVSLGVDVDYHVFNVGPGPLHVVSVDIVEGDAGSGNAVTDCTRSCTTRASCTGSTTPECKAFRFTVPPRANYDIAGGSLGKPTSEKVTTNLAGDIHFDPPASSGTTLMACTRITTDDPFNPVVCGDLKGKKP